MNKFFVPKEVYNDRLAICKDCIYYFKPTGNCKECGCFMRIKARLAPLSCPKGYWNKTTDVITPDDLPPEIVKAVTDIWPDIKRGVAKNQTVKKKMIEIYNTIHNTNYSYGTSCGTCLNTCYEGLKKINEKYNGY